jgi:hypothetical protein
VKILFEYPTWLLFICIILAAAVAFIFYRRDRQNQHLSPTLRVILGIFRFITLAILAALLVRPLIKTIERDIEPPIILIAQDNSESIAQTADSTFYNDAWKQNLEQLAAKLGEQYQVVRYAFGDDLIGEERFDSLQYSSKVTDFSKLLDGLYNRHSNRNIGAVIIASDGIYNAGADPVYAGKKLNAPVYTLALGDTTPQRDLRVAEANANRLAYLGNRFPIQIVSEARKAAGMLTRITIEHKGQIVYSESLTIGNDYLLDTRTAVLEARSGGLQRYTVRIEGVANEVTLVNNRRDVYIDVLENRQKVLILAAVPHPDVAALRKSIESNENYEVTVATAQEFSGKTDDYSLVVFHQIPSKSGFGNTFLSERLIASQPFLVVVGAETNLQGFNALKLGYSFAGARGGATTDAQAIASSGFSLFTLDDDANQMIKEFPPLAVPFGDLESAPGATPLMFRRIGPIETETTLIGFNSVNGVKFGVIGGEGIWRWRLVQFLKNGNHSRFDKLMSSMMQYLASRDDRRQFRVSAPRDVLENERIVFTAEVYNAAYEVITDPEVQLEIRNAEDQVYTFGFGRSGNGYRADLGSLPAGDYNWIAKTTVGGKVLEERGELTLAELQLESARMEADHGMLYRLAQENGGALYLPDQIDALADAILSSEDMVTVSYERTKLSDAINLWVILVILLALLSLEWLLRKWSGTY